MSSSQLLRSLDKSSASPLNQTRIVGRKVQLGTTRKQNPDSWDVRADWELQSFITYGGSQIYLVLGTFLAIPVLVRHPFKKISTSFFRVV